VFCKDDDVAVLLDESVEYVPFLNRSFEAFFDEYL